MAFRDELEAARARIEALEAELAKAPRPPARELGVWVWRLGFIAVVALVPVSVALLATLPNHEETLLWRGTMDGTDCLLRTDVNVQFDRVLVGEWDVTVRCGNRVVFHREAACCTDEKGDSCRLVQRRALGMASYEVTCDDAPLHVDSARRRLVVERRAGAPIEIDLSPRSADIVVPLFDEDGPHSGFAAYAPSD